MGLLDDAIKEHLELKRRHGADPGEVARLEHEALGPARREPAAAAPAPPEAPEYEYEYEDEDEVPASERLEGPVDDDVPDRVPEFHPEASSPPPSSVDQPTREFSVEELEEAEQEPPRPRDEPRDERRAPHEERRAPDEDVVPADEEPEGEDVLEETPEFLQETPEHDRLWFEQKPPKDFDF